MEQTHYKHTILSKYTYYNFKLWSYHIIYCSIGVIINLIIIFGQNGPINLEPFLLY